MSVMTTLGTVETSLLVACLMGGVMFLGKTLYERLNARITELRDDLLDRVNYLHSRIDLILQISQRQADIGREEKRQ